MTVLNGGGLAGVADKRDAKTTHSDKPCSDVRLNRKKSAEVILPGNREGPNSDSLLNERKVRQCEESRIL